MAPRCRKIKYKEKRSSKALVPIKKLAPSTNPSSSSTNSAEPRPFFHIGEGEYEGISQSQESIMKPQKSTLECLKEWVGKQKFIPQDLSDDFLTLFLSAAGYGVEAAAEQLMMYFYSRQKPSPLFRDRDPLSPENIKLFRKLYVLPMPGTTEDGRKVILTGLIKPTTTYSQMDHAKALAMVFDLLIWAKDFGFGDFVIVLDGRGFECPQLLENKVYNHRSINSLLLNTIPGTLRSFYFFHPPPHVANVADNRNGIWVTVIKTKQEMISYLPPNILPLEYGGNLGHLEDLLEKWELHLIQSRDFFVHFEKRMINDYRRKMCYENEIKERGKGWVQRMKLVADEWEYKMQYYERMKNMIPFSHPAFGSQRNVMKPNEPPYQDPLKKCRQRAKEEAEASKVFEPSRFYNGYAKEIRKAQMEAEKQTLERVCELSPVLELQIVCP